MSTGPLARRMVPVLAAGLALVAASPAAAKGPGASPPLCNPSEPTYCIVKGGGANTTVSPKLVKKGDTLTVTLTPNDGYAGVASYASQPAFSPIKGGRTPQLKLTKCTGGKLNTVPDEPYHVPSKMAGPRICKYKVMKGGAKWHRASWSYNVRYGGLAAYSQDSFAGIGEDDSFVEGFVRGLPRNAGDKEGPGVSGMKVTAASKKDKYSGKTDTNGFYSIEIKKPGKYEIFPKRRPSDLDLKPIPPIKPEQRKLTIDEEDTFDKVNFTLQRGDQYRTRFLSGGNEIAEVFANGATRVDVEINVLDLNDQPVRDKKLFLQVNSDTLTPRSALCKSGGGGLNRIWPGAAEAGIRRPTVDQTVDVVSGGDGRATLELWPGTEGGEWSMTVRGKFALPTEQPQTARLNFIATGGGDLAGQMRAALGNVPNAPRPSNNAANDPQSAHGENMDWLFRAFEANQLGGWTFLPVKVEGVHKFGLIFHPLGAPPAVDPDGSVKSGQVFNEGGGRGLQPIADGEPLQDLGAWAGGKRVLIKRKWEYPWSDLTYLGYPIETDAVTKCVGSAN